MSEGLTIYYNPNCGTCRKTLGLLEERGSNPEIIEYLKEAPDRDTLQSLLTKLGLPAKAIVRTKDESFASLKIDMEDDAAVVDALVANPRLIQRPIVVSGNRAVLGRPPETVLQLFAES